MKIGDLVEMINDMTANSRETQQYTLHIDTGYDCSPLKHYEVEIDPEERKVTILAVSQPQADPTQERFAAPIPQVMWYETEEEEGHLL